VLQLRFFYINDHIVGLIVKFCSLPATYLSSADISIQHATSTLLKITLLQLQLLQQAAQLREEEREGCRVASAVCICKQRCCCWWLT